MDISFANTRLRLLCHDERAQQRQLGAIDAKRLRSRLADLDAAACVTELVAGRPHPLKGDRAGEFAMEIGRGRLP